VGADMDMFHPQYMDKYLRMTTELEGYSISSRRWVLGLGGSTTTCICCDWRCSVLDEKDIVHCRPTWSGRDRCINLANVSIKP